MTDTTHTTHFKILWTHAFHAKISTQATHVTHAKILWSHTTHDTHAKIWPTPPTLPASHTLFKTLYRNISRGNKNNETEEKQRREQCFNKLENVV